MRALALTECDESWWRILEAHARLDDAMASAAGMVVALQAIDEIGQAATLCRQLIAVLERAVAEVESLERKARARCKQ